VESFAVATAAATLRPPAAKKQRRDIGSIPESIFLVLQQRNYRSSRTASSNEYSPGILSRTQLCWLFKLQPAAMSAAIR
jgi:hypothetical protein